MPICLSTGILRIHMARVTCPDMCPRVHQLFSCKTPKNQMDLIWEHIYPDPRS